MAFSLTNVKAHELPECPVEMEVPHTTSRQLHGLLTQLLNLVGNANDVPAAMRSIADLYTKGLEVEEELLTLKALVSLQTQTPVCQFIPVETTQGATNE